MCEVLDRTERIEVGRVVAGDERAAEACALEQAQDGSSLVRADRRQHLEHLAPEARHEPFLLRAFGDLLQLDDRMPVVLAMTEVECDRQPLQLRLVRRPWRARGEVDDLMP